MSSTLEVAPYVEAPASPEVLTQEIVAMAQRLENLADPMHTGFRETVGVQVTPLQETNRVPLSGHRLLLKNETVHPCNAYKVRGATAGTLAALEQNPDLETVVCASAGNHAKGLLEAASKLGLQCVTHCSTNASEAKQYDLVSGGVTLVNRYDSLADALAGAEAEVTIDMQAGENKKAFIHPFDQTEVMAGQATLMQETLQQLAEAGFDLQNDTVDLVVPAGGKGMAAGCAAWLAHARAQGEVGPNVHMTVVEVVDEKDGRQLDKSGVAWCDGTATHDGARSGAILEHSTEHIDTVYVSQTEVAQAMHGLTAALGKRIEPAGALATAGAKKMAAQHPKTTIVDGKVRYKPARTYVSVVSGANVSNETYARATQLRDEAYRKTLDSLATLVTNEGTIYQQDDGRIDRSLNVVSGK